MAYLTLGGITVPVAEQAVKNVVEVGVRSPAVTGMPRSSILARKHVWSVKTGTMAAADADALRAVLLAPTVSAGGDWLGSITVWPVLGAETPGDTALPSVVMNFTLAES